MPSGKLQAMTRVMAARRSRIAGKRVTCTAVVSAWFPSSISSTYLHFVRSPVLHAGARTIENAYDMKSVSQNDVQHLFEPKLADEMVEVAVDVSQLRPKNISAAAAYHPVARRHCEHQHAAQGNTEAGQRKTTIKHKAHFGFVPESHGCKS